MAISSMDDVSIDEFGTRWAHSVCLCGDRVSWARADGPWAVMGGFVTEAYARKGWFNRLFTYVASGKYSLGADSGIILAQDRRVRGPVSIHDGDTRPCPREPTPPT
jgi:hypothetical protein